MARPRNKKSDNSFGGYNLKPEEDIKLQKLLEEKDLTAKRLVRALLRSWIKKEGQEELKCSQK